MNIFFTKKLEYPQENKKKRGEKMKVHIPARGEIETDKVIKGIESLKGLTELEFKIVAEEIEEYFKNKKEKLTFDVQIMEDEFLKKIVDHYSNPKYFHCL